MQISLLPGRDASQVVAALSERGATVTVNGSTIVALIEDPILLELASLSAVEWIGPYRVPRILNDQTAAIVGVDLAAANGYDGTGQIVAVTDTGFGTGVVGTAHRDIPSSRIVAIHNYPDSSFPGCWTSLPDGPQDVDSGHGTHVTGSVLSDGIPTGPDTGLGQGMAPGAHLVFQAVEDYRNYSGLPIICDNPDGYYLGALSDYDLEDVILADAYDDGARIHSNSWGTDVAGEYTETSQAMDQFTWDHPDMLVVVAAGNAGIDADLDGLVDAGSVGAPATVKNVLTVGASEGSRDDGYPCDTGLAYVTCFGSNSIFTYGSGWPADFPADPLLSDPSAGNAQQMAAFSSRGPTADGRIKPDVVAPGTWILSTYSGRYQEGYDVGQNPQNGEYQYDGWGHPLNQEYKYFGGTSMATPIVSGAAALVRQYYTDTEAHTPSAALLKATLINSAVDLADENNDGTDDNLYSIPNAHEGWGRINVNEATDGDHTFADNASVGPGESVTYHVEASGVSNLKITVVWTDQASTLAASTNLVNDLDLSVNSPSGTSTYLGNVFLSGWSTTGGVADDVNNVENVYVSDATAGVWTVEIAGSNIPQGPQPFAIVVDGGSFVDIVAPEWPEGAEIDQTATTGTSITVDWSGNPATDSHGVTEYFVYVDEVMDQSVSGTTATVTGLADSTEYSIVVEASDAAGNLTNDGPSLVAWTLDLTPPQWPDLTIRSREVFETTAELTWAPATDDNGISEYTVEYQGEVIGTTSGTTLVVTDLTPGATHLLTITAHDPSGNATTGPAIDVTTARDFADTNGSIFEDDIAWLAARGITVGCDDSNFCPHARLTRAQMASLLAQAFELEPIDGNLFDDASGIHEANINAIAEAVITLGCSPGGRLFCPNSFVPRGQMASFLARAFELDPSNANAFSDDNGSVHEPNIDAIAIAGITSGCQSGLFCPSSVVTRGQVAAFLHRGFVDLGLD